MKTTPILFFFALSLLGADAQRIRIGMPIPVSATSSPSFSGFVLQDGAKVGWVFMAIDADVMTHFRFKPSVFGSPSYYKVSLQTVVTTTNVPSGTVLAAAAFIPANGGTMQDYAITRDGSGNVISSYTLARGTVYSIVVEPCPDSVLPCPGLTVTGTTNYISVGHKLPNFILRNGLPYAVTYSAGGPWIPTVEMPTFGYKTATVTRGVPIENITVPTAISLGAEHAVQFNLPSSVCSTYKVAGVHANVTTGATGKTIKMSLYGGVSAFTVLQSNTLYSDQVRSVGAAWQDLESYFADSSLATLTCGNTYRIGFAPQAASTSFILHQIDLNAASDRSAFPGGTWFAASKRTSCTGGAVCPTCCNETTTAWADSTAVRPMIDLIIDDLTLPSGTSGQKGYTFVGALQRNPLDLFTLVRPTRRLIVKGHR